ncbi:MAG TPA: site-specific integrase, partial [Nevskiaceae bacterium]
LRMLAPMMEDRALEDGPDIAAQIRAKYQAEGLAASTVNQRMAVIRRLLSLAYRRWGWLDRPLYQRVQMMSLHNERQMYLTPEEVEALADLCPHGHDAVLLAAYTGIRRGQLLRLTAENRVGDCIHLGTEGKTGRPQLIPLHERVQSIQLPLLVTDAVLRREWDAARKKLNLTHVHFHDLRHSFASWLIASGADLMYVREFLGHSTVAVTQRYAHLQTKHLREALNRVK